MMRWFLFVMVIFASSCTALVQIPRLEGERIPPEKLSSVVETFQHQTEDVHTFKALLRVRARRGNTTQSNRIAIYYRAPDQFVFEFFPTTSFYLLQRSIVSEGKYESRNEVEHTDEVGTVTPDAIEQLLGIEVDPSLLPSILLAGLSPGDFEASTKGGTLQLRNYSPGTLYCEVSEPEHRINLCQHYGIDGHHLFTITYTKYGTADGKPVPIEMEVTIPKLDVAITLSLVSIKLNVQVSDEIFTFHAS